MCGLWCWSRGGVVADGHRDRTREGADHSPYTPGAGQQLWRLRASEYFRREVVELMHGKSPTSTLVNPIGSRSVLSESMLLISYRGCNSVNN